jgi:hypothetical protein
MVTSGMCIYIRQIGKCLVNLQVYRLAMQGCVTEQSQSSWHQWATEMIALGPCETKLKFMAIAHRRDKCEQVAN